MEIMSNLVKLSSAFEKWDFDNQTVDYQILRMLLFTLLNYLVIIWFQLLSLYAPGALESKTGDTSQATDKPNETFTCPED